MPEPISIVCPRCQFRSYNRHDIAQGYCVRCHAFTSKPEGWTPRLVLKSFHLEVGVPCPVCRQRFAEGEEVTLMFISARTSPRPAYVHVACYPQEMK